MKKKNWKKWIIPAAVLILLAVGLFACSARSGESMYQEVTVEERDINTYLEFSGNIEAVDYASAYAEASAKVLEVCVEEGDEVKTGDILAVLDSGDVEYNIRLKEAALEQSRRSSAYSIKDSQTGLSNLEEQLDQGLNSSLNSAERALLNAQQAYLDAVEAYNEKKADVDAGRTSAVVSARQQLDTTMANYELYRERHDKGMLSDEEMEIQEISLANAQENYWTAQENAKKDVENAWDAVESAERSLQNAELDYETSLLSLEQNHQNYADALEKTQALSDTTTSEMELEHLKESLADYTIYAPIDGFVTQLNLRAGEYTGAMTAAAVVTSFDTMQVAVKIDEYDIGSVSEGDPVTVYVDALDAEYAGKISRIARTATIQNDVSYLETIVEFETDDRIRSGLSAEVQLTEADLKAVPTLPVNAVSYDTDNTAYVLVPGEKGEMTRQPVTLGVSDGSWVQITEGLEVGDVVYYNAITDMLYMQVGPAAMAQ